MAEVDGKENFQERLKAFWPGEVHFDVSMAKYSTLKVGGAAKALVIPREVGEIVSLVSGCETAKISWMVVGGGSNLLVGDEGYGGVVIVLGRKFSDIRIQGKDDCSHTLVDVDAGCSLARLLNWSQEMGLSGLEFTAGIPGTVGGAVAMNAGAWGGEIKDVLSSLTWFASGEISRQDISQLDFTYRCCLKPVDAIVLSATFLLNKEDKAKITKTCREYIAARKSKQPVAYGSGGSFFKNPVDVPAGKLIEDAGLKGTKIGGAEVSEVHANFILNTGDATANDIIKLMSLVQTRVREVHGIWLEPEIKIIATNREKAVGEK